MVPGSSSRNGGLIGLGAFLVVAGVVAVGVQAGNYSVCSSTLGQISQGLSAGVAQSCTTTNVVFFGGIAAGLLGVVLVVVGLVTGRGAGFVAMPPGWYRGPDGFVRWWDGRAWTAIAPPGGAPPAQGPYPPPGWGPPR